MSDHRDLVARIKADLEARGISLAGSCGAFEITQRVAWALRGDGAGLLEKPSGNNCQGYSVDYVIFSGGRGFDMLGDAGGANEPRWSEAVDMSFIGRWRAPIDPGDDLPPIPPLPENGLTVALAALLARLDALDAKLDTLDQRIAGIQHRADELKAAVKGIKLTGIVNLTTGQTVLTPGR